MRKITWAIPAAMLVVGCFPAGSHGPLGPGARGGASILASVEGITDDDRKVMGETGYWLECESGVRLKGELKKNGEDQFIRFADGKQVKDGDLCALEVRGDKEPKGVDIVWHAVPEEKARGLYFASSYAKVEKRRLKLTVYRLFTIRNVDADTFTAVIHLETPEGESQPTTDGLAANLVCGPEDGRVDIAGGKWTKAEGARSKVTFELQVEKTKKDLEGKECHELVVMNDSNVAAWKATGLSISFVGEQAPKADETVEFGKDTPYVLQAIETGDIDVDVDDGGPCLDFDAEAKVCRDLREVSLPFAETYFLAKVHGKTQQGSGESVRYLVTLKGQEDALGRAKGLLTTAALNAQIEGGAANYLFYDESLEQGLFEQPFDADFVKGSKHAEHLVSADALKDVMILAIEKVWVHGFHKVDASRLDQESKAHWFVKISFAGKEFLAGGKEPYFYSPATPLERSSNKFFDVATLVEEMKGGGSDKWSVYAMKGAVMATAACELALSDYVSALSARHLSNMADTESRMDACRIGPAAFDQTLAPTAPYELSYWLLGWFTL